MGPPHAGLMVYCATLQFCKLRIRNRGFGLKKREKRLHFRCSLYAIVRKFK